VVNRIFKTQSKLILIISLASWLIFILPSLQASAQWPPFGFYLTPTYEDGRITYNIRLSSRVDWTMSDVTVKIPLPPGTRFLEANAPPTTSVDFDGEEITFFTSTIHRPVRDISFVVEVIDPTITVFPLSAWISWEGDQPGEYLIDEKFDITRQPLDWPGAPRSALQLDVKAVVSDDNIITYSIYPENVDWRRMWDLKINVPIPEGTTFLEAKAPPPFVTDFDGREVSFFVIELERWTEVNPLEFKISTTNVASPFVVTHAWAGWKNVKGLQEQTVTGDIVVQPHIPEQVVVSDVVGDVPMPNYDVTSISPQVDGADLKVAFYLAGDIGLIDDPVEYMFYIDQDCHSDSGTYRKGLGAEHILRYRHNKGKADLRSWDTEKKRWGKAVDIKSLIGGQMVAMWVPLDLLDNSGQFCWIGQARNTTKIFIPNPPTEWAPNLSDLRLTQYELTHYTPQTNREVDLEPTPAVESISEKRYLIQIGEEWQYLKGYGEASYPTTAWQQVNYDDTGWFSGPTGIGYGDGDDTTELDDMRNNYVSIYMRHKFSVLDPDQVQSLTLEIDYDDGFIAYLNGTEVAQRNISDDDGPILYNTQAETHHEAGSGENIDITSFIGLLSGENVLVIQGFNDKRHGSDFSISPALSGEYAEIITNKPVTNSLAFENNSADPIYYGETTSEMTTPLTHTITGIRGKLAVPILNDQNYDVYVFSLPDGQEITRISNARQPHIRIDGQRMLVNHEGNGVENVYEYDFVEWTEQQVSDAPQDWYPFYDTWGNRVVYGNDELAVGSDGLRHSYLFVQCGLLPPHEESEQRCKNIPQFGILVPAGQSREIWGTHPVWTSSDMIAYKGCNSWAGFSACGIYIVPAASTKGFSDGFIPRQLTKDTSDIPADTKGDLIAFTSRRDGDWEVYVMDLNGMNLRNLSTSQESNDGLPTISPDGQWVAFVSDRGGQWSVWAVPTGGGQTEKLFDLPDTPWGSDDLSWTNERISWGP